MKEELYIIKEGKRIEVDLISPSGIVLRFCSNLLNDLSKIDCSKSYTFQLPATANNVRNFDLIDDIRHVSSMYGKKISCEYWLDGIQIVKDGNLYVSDVKDGKYSAVMTFGVIQSLVTLNDNDISIRSLQVDERIKYGTAVNTDYSQYDATTFDTNATQNALYSAGLVFALNMGVSQIISREVRSDAVDGTRARIRVGQPSYPTPVVPLYKILGAISDEYRLRFSSSLFARYTYAQYMRKPTDNILLVGGIPLVSTQMSQDLIDEHSVKYIDFNGVVERSFTYRGIRGEQKTITIPNVLNPSSVGRSSNPDIIDVYETSQSHEPITSFKLLVSCADLEIDGILKLQYYNQTITSEKPVLKLVMPDYNGGIVEIASIDGKEDFSVAIGGRYVWDFREQYGMSKHKVSAALPTNTPIMFQISVVPDEYVESSLNVIPVFEEGIGGHKIETFNNLPDISCMTLLKSLYYMIGGFPKIDADGRLGVSYFTDLKKNIANGNVYNWSKYLLEGNKLPEINFTNKNFGQNNYYLMKNESLDESSKKDSEDVFGGNKFCIRCDNENLERNKTVHQFPFYGKFLQHGSNISVITGDATKYWSLKDNKATASEAKPTFGTFSIENDLLRFNVWEFNGGAEYQYLQQILSNPIFVKMPMQIPLLSLVSIEYTKPVYIEQLNSLFAIIEINVKSDGNCDVEFLKIPNE